MELQIVSHCWNYSRLLTYQLSSIVLYPPTELSVTMTVFYNEEDHRTCEVLKYFAGLEVPRVRWHWWRLDQPQLFRRAIGRNMAALANQADWVWFTDCDQVFRGCLDPLARHLRETRRSWPSPASSGAARTTESDSPLLTRLDDPARRWSTSTPADFRPVRHEKAVAAPCRSPAATGAADRLLQGHAQVHETASRSLEADLRGRGVPQIAGHKGVPIDVPGLFRIEHLSARAAASGSARPSNSDRRQKLHSRVSGVVKIVRLVSVCVAVVTIQDADFHAQVHFLIEKHFPSRLGVQPVVREIGHIGPVLDGRTELLPFADLVLAFQAEDRFGNELVVRASDFPVLYRHRSGQSGK